MKQHFVVQPRSEEQVTLHERVLMRVMGMLLSGYPHDFAMTALVSLMATVTTRMAHSDDEMDQLIGSVTDTLREAYEQHKHEHAA